MKIINFYSTNFDKKKTSYKSTVLGAVVLHEDSKIGAIIVNCDRWISLGYLCINIFKQSVKNILITHSKDFKQVLRYNATKNSDNKI